MSRPILILENGQHLFHLEKIASFGDAIGFTRDEAYGQAGTWPLVGPKGAVSVVSELALKQLGIPYRHKFIERRMP
jgi:hypothetical protein